MKQNKNGIFIVVVAMLSTASLLIAGSEPLSAAESGARYGGTFRFAEEYDGVSIGYPAKITMVYGNRQAAPAVETLLRTDKAGKPIPWLAIGFKEDAKAKTITLTLRKGVKFHDGTDFNAEAAKWNLSQHVAVKSQTVQKFKSIDIIDDYTVRINLTEWDSTVTGNLAQILGMIISPTAYAKNGEAWCASHPVGTGPFEFVSWQKDVRTIYKKFDGYWQKDKPYLDRIEDNVVGDPFTRELGLRKGEFDSMITLIAKGIRELEKDGYDVFRARVGSSAYSLVPESANPNSPWANLKVRQAAHHAIDTEAIVKGVFFGLFEPANQLIYKGHWGYNPSVVGYPYNPAKAKQLLAEAGYPNGFKSRMMYRTNPQSDAVYTAVQGYFKTVGIDLELDPVQSARYTQTAYQGGKWEGLLQGPISPNPDLAGMLALRYSGGPVFFTQMLVPDDYLKAIQNAISAPDFEAKQRWTQEATKMMVDKYCMMMMLYLPTEFVVSKTSVHSTGIDESPNNGIWTPEEAWMDR